jgi:hypothetical protein
VALNGRRRSRRSGALCGVRDVRSVKRERQVGDGEREGVWEKGKWSSKKRTSRETKVRLDQGHRHDTLFGQKGNQEKCSV